VIHYANSLAGDVVNVFYSTPSIYTAAKLAQNIEWPVVTGEGSHAAAPLSLVPPTHPPLPPVHRTGPVVGRQTTSSPTLTTPTRTGRATSPPGPA